MKAKFKLAPILLLAASPLQAVPTIPNPSFEGNIITGYPGYGEINGWQRTSGGGLNPATGQNPFADNGVIPSPPQVAFVQANQGVGALGTTITGLDPGTTYRVNFRANSRLASAPDGEGVFFRALMDSVQVPVSLDYSAPITNQFRVRPVGVGKPYHYLSLVFTARKTEAALKLEATADLGDRTLLVDDFTIVEESSVTASRWTNDASSGISAATTLWAYQFGSAVDTTIDGVPVFGILQSGASSQIVTPDFTLSGPNARSADSNSLTFSGAGPGSAVVGSNFIYGGSTSQFVVNNLSAGKNYVLSLLTVGWQLDASTLSRLIYFSTGGKGRLISQSQYGSDNGIRIDIPFTASASTHVINAQTEASVSMHIYGVSLNRGPLLVTSASDSGNGSLREALALAGAYPGKSTIRFDRSLGGQTIALTSGQLNIPATEGITIDASDLILGLTIDAGGNSRVMEALSGAKTILKGLTLAGGVRPSHQGGGLLMREGTLELDSCIIRDNVAYLGGGLSILAGSPGASVRLNRCTFDGNSATFGGGIGYFLGPDGDVVDLTECTLTGNSASSGGGIFIFSSTVLKELNLDACTVVGNSGSDTAGGIFSDIPVSLENGLHERGW